ncbi:endonuclease/exonuclease/phosphatase family protein [Amycolatopsis thermophila]|uniref:Endonuclease/exonuclease/phosphatase (EEP) superfamily protein YafD n=1 Tax=Amycolatopsis thermophila TaxID=206084 RepID=A0ABU0ETY1_9PSEU|nr:endonuclease/exonuclease/phosphatase family protein [Amycolatopsis thermophila]MDQ0378765.1 endonuclease/exonuclease/phosphatase (EEP) superfamily protein YafD [Amycolatopsis thermophila]
MVFFAVLAAVFAVFAAMRLAGVDGGRLTSSLVALTPYWVVCGLVLAVLTLALRHWWIGGIVLVLALAVGGVVLPRAFPAAQPQVHGRTLRVMSSNMYFGEADPQTLVRLVRDNQVDVLNLLELTPQAVSALEAAGLFDVLPHRVLEPAPRGAGSGLVSRYPVTELSLAGPSGFAQPSARLDLGGGVSIEVVAVHPTAPVADAGAWKSEIAGLPHPAPHGPVRVLAGDFNATLDHVALRNLISTGYADAGSARGDGFTATWPSKLLPPPVTIDHVLVDRRAAVTGYRVFPMPDSDHKAVFAAITLP